jgi:VIT1/CCC1 family predicted Fe2+/Mn2+ transporter
MSMAAGEYVSVSSQADTEHADLKLERRELASSPASEKVELARIYIDRGLDSELASKVAGQLMAHDALKSHARDELGITETGVARPIQAALASAATFTVGAALPLTVGLVAPYESLVYSVSVASLFFLIILGIVAARTGGANLLKGALRVGFWGAFAMVVTALIGKLFGTVTQ